MREWLKNLGQLFGGIGLVIAALIYLLNFQRESAVLTREQRGRLQIISAELDSHQRVLTRYLQDPRQIIDASSEMLKVTRWYEHGSNVAQALSIQDFTILGGYYADIELLRGDLKHVVPQGQEVEELRKRMQVYVSQLSYIQMRLHYYVLNLSGSEPAGK